MPSRAEPYTSPSGLPYFVDLCRIAVLEGRTAVEASHVLGIARSTLTRSLDRVEAGLGVRLFDRTEGGFSATDQGRNVLAHVQRMKALLDEAAFNAYVFVGYSTAGSAGYSDRVTPSHLRALLALCKLQSIPHAARSVGMTANGLIVALRDAENCLGIQLICRVGRVITFTLPAVSMGTCLEGAMSELQLIMEQRGEG